jgi:hypothetical protein
MSPHRNEQFTPVESCSLLIVIPGTVNYFYNLYARWMAEAFQRMGLKVDLRVLGEIPNADYDLCILSNVCEIEWAHRGLGPRTRILALRRQCKTLITLTADCVHTHWFRNNLAVACEIAADAMIDVGFVPQDDPELKHRGIRYHFAFDGLLSGQAAEVATFAKEEEAARPIPWAHVAGRNAQRVGLTDRLLTGISPGGFVYLPSPSPITEKGSPHLNADQMNRILERTRYYIWFSKHGHFFMESLRFKMAWQSGCVPIQVVEDSAILPDHYPFSDWVMREGEVVDRVRALRFVEARQAFREEYHPREQSAWASARPEEKMTIRFCA